MSLLWYLLGLLILVVFFLIAKLLETKKKLKKVFSDLKIVTSLTQIILALKDKEIELMKEEREE